MNKFFIHIFCFLVLALNSFGQDDYIFNTRHLTVEDGLIGRRITAIVQDNDGFIWIATNEGLNRFDGYTFEHFTKSTHGLNANNIGQLSKDDEGDIWVSYYEDKFFRSETQIIRPSTLKVLSIQKKLGTLYKEEYKSLGLINGHRNNCVFLSNRVTFERYIYKNNRITKLKNTNKIIYNEITDELWNTKEGSNKIYHIDVEGNVLDTLTYNFPIEVLSITETNKGGVFVYGEQNGISAIYYKSINSKQFKKVTLKDNTKKIYNVSNCIIGGGDEETFYLEYNGRIITYPKKNLDGRVFRTSIFDNQGNLWLGSNNGVFILTVKEQRFKQYLKDRGKEGKPYDGRGIWADNEVMYAVSGSNSYRYQFKEASPILIDDLNALSIIKSKDNSFWIGSKKNQLYNIDLPTGLKKAVNGTSNQIWALCEDKNNRIWIGQGNKGLYYYDPDKMEETQKYNQLNSYDKIEKGKIVHIVEDRRDNNLLWLSCQSGWYLLDINKGLQKRFWSRATDDTRRIFGDEIHYTYQDDDGFFWLATAYSGLVKVKLSPNYEVISTKQFTVTEGFSSNTIYAIYEDDNGSLWMSTNNGINRFDKKTEEVQVFLEEDGLPHYEFNRLSNFQRADGTIFFGTLNGIVSFHPKDLSDIKAYDVPVKISRCEKFSNDKERMVNITAEVFTKNKIIIAPSQRLTNLYISVQNYADALKTKYVYRIKGIQDEFIVINKNEISLSGLPYGRHTLEVKAKAPDGRFSESIISIPLIVQRPFYLQWWFVLLTIFSIGFSIWQLFQARTRVLKNRKRELEEIVKDRTSQLQKQTSVLQEQATQLQLDKNIIEGQAKELRSLDEMKSRFFANISHELRTPLTLILSPVQSIIKRKKTDNRDFTSAQIIEQNANKLLKRINEILDLTKLEAKEMQLRTQPTPFYEFIKRLVATFESLAAQKDQRLTFDFQLDKNLNILLDQDKYEHIFNNYLSNAIKYTPKGGQINIQLTEKQVELNDNLQNRIVLAVSDNGQGIPKVDIPKVFNRFFQSKNNQNKTGSSGIGLALSKEIAVLMNGEVKVESEAGEGSQFYFEMPFVEELTINNVELIIDKNPEKHLLNFKNLVNVNPISNTNKSTILLVEDNPQLRNYIQLILQEKYNVVTAENGKQALLQLGITNYELGIDANSEAIPNYSDKPHERSSQFLIPNLIISDIMMPFMDGFELLEQLKASDQFRHIPVVMLTARSNAQDKLKALRIGVDDYILKPFNEDELTARIDNLIKNATSRTVISQNESESKSKKATTPTISAADLKWLESVEKHLKVEISNSKFNIDSLALVMQMSRSHLHRRIKSITGLPPNKYFREIKLQAAREILENGEVQTVGEVCYAVGFDTPKYFSKVFAQRFGKRPVSYLKLK